MPGGTTLLQVAIDSFCLFSEGISLDNIQEGDIDRVRT